MDITISPRYYTLWSPSQILVQYDNDIGRLYYRPGDLPDRPTTVHHPGSHIWT